MRSTVELVDHLVEHRERRAPFDPGACCADRLGVEQADLLCPSKRRPELGCGHELRTVDQRSDGDVIGMPSSVVTSSGCNGGPRWIATPGMDAAVRGSSPDPATKTSIGGRFSRPGGWPRLAGPSPSSLRAFGSLRLRRGLAALPRGPAPGLAPPGGAPARP